MRSFVGLVSLERLCSVAGGLWGGGLGVPSLHSGGLVAVMIGLRGLPRVRAQGCSEELCPRLRLATLRGKSVSVDFIRGNGKRSRDTTKTINNKKKSPKECLELSLQETEF